MSKALVFVAAMLAAPAMAADQQFDLICKAKKAEVRYRVDLARGEWCADSCDRVMKIADVTSGMILFYNDQPSPPENFTGYSRVNRANGAWEWYAYAPRTMTRAMDHKGACQLAPFTRFPVAKF